MKVAAIGFCCTDVYENLNRHYPTGNGIDCIVNLAKRGIQTSAITAIGKDIYGKEMLDLCSKYGIDSTHIQINKGDDITFAKTHDYIHTDMFGHVLHLLPEFRNAGCKIIFDFSLNKNFDELSTILPNIDFGFFSFETYSENVKDFLKKAHSYGPKIVTATFGTEGSMSYDGKSFYNQSIYPAEVVNTVGAGDSFISGYVYGLIQGLDIPGCLDCGARTSAEIVQKFEPY